MGANITGIRLWAALAALSAAAAAHAMPKSVSRAQWLWAEPSGDPPTNAYLRLKFEVDGAVKKAWFYQFRDKRGSFYFNGKGVNPVLFPDQRDNFYGHVKGSGVDLTPLVRQGENVIAIELGRTAAGCYGIMLRGEVEFEDGRRITLISSPDMVKGSPVEVAGWKDPGFDDSSWKPAYSQGDVRTTPWAVYGDVPRAFMLPDEYARYRESLLAGFPEERLLSEPEFTYARVVYSGDTPGISINGGSPIPPDRLTSVSVVHSDAQDEALARGRALHEPRDVDELDRGVDDVLRMDHVREDREARVGDGHDGRVRLDRAEGEVLRLRVLGAGEGVEEGGLADVGQADDADVECHVRVFLACGG